MTLIRIENGTYRNTSVNGKVFTLVEPFKATAKGGHVTVKNDNAFPGYSDEIRIKVSGPHDYSFVQSTRDSISTEIPAATTTTETDDEVMERLRTRFSVLNSMTEAACTGDIRAMIVSGPRA